MMPQTELLELITRTAEENCHLDMEISLKELPKDDGIYAELGDGFTDTAYYDKSTVKIVPVLFLCRSVDQKRGLEELCGICSYLQRLKQYPKGQTFTWLDTTVAKEPTKIGRDEDGTYHFSCILNCRVFY